MHATAISPFIAESGQKKQWQHVTGLLSVKKKIIFLTGQGQIIYTAQKPDQNCFTAGEM